MDDGSGTGTADMNMKYIILGFMQKEIIVSMCHGRGTGTADMNMKFLIHGYIYMHLEMIVSRRWRLMNIRHTFYSCFPPNIKCSSREGDAVKSRDYFAPEQETTR